MIHGTMENAANECHRSSYDVCAFELVENLRDHLPDLPRYVVHESNGHCGDLECFTIHALVSFFR